MRAARSCVPWLVATIVVASAVARAQSSVTPPRPYRGLFGGDEESGARKQQFDLTVEGYGGYESNIALAQSTLFGGPPIEVAPSPTTESNPVPTAGSSMFGASATVEYSRRWQRASVNTYGSVTSSRYSSINNAARTGYSGGVGFDVPLSRRMSLVASTAVTWTPYYEIGSLFPPLPPLGDLDVQVTSPSFELGLVPATALRSLSDVRVSREFSRRSRIDAFYTRTATQFQDTSFTTFDTSDTRAGIEFNRTLSRYMTLRLGYDYRVGRLGDLPQQQYHSHEINAGVDYHRAFNLWHRTTFSFTTGSTVFANQPLQVLGPPIGLVTTPGLSTDSLLGPDTNATDIRVILTGTGSLVWEFLRSWAARVQAIRGVNYLEGFGSPALTNSISAGVGGMVTHRVQLGAGGSYATGSIGTTKLSSNGYGSWNGFASADYAMTRHLALYGRYFYYDYGFQQGVVLPPGISNNFRRNGARFGVKAWVPLCKCR